jgi:hypothetical protein
MFNPSDIRTPWDAFWHTLLLLSRHSYAASATGAVSSALLSSIAPRQPADRPLC